MKAAHIRSTTLAVLLAAAAFAPAAHADEILLTQASPYQHSTFFTGSDADTLTFDTTGAGTVNVALEDLGWPVKLDSLSFSASSESKILQSGSGNIDTSFAVTGAGAFYTHLAAQAGSLGIAGLPDFGLYAMQITFTPAIAPAPLPASFWFLATGLLGLGIARLRTSRSAALLPGSLAPVTGLAS
jgi:hypothetical protein